MVTTRKAVAYEPGGRLDFKNPDLYADPGYHERLARIRAEEPVYWNPEADGAGFWAITRYKDALAVLGDPATFSAAVENGGMRIFNKQDVVEQPPHANIFSMDPPRHTELRRALLPLFTPQAVAAREARIRARIRKLMDRIADAGSAEFVSAVAAPMTLGLLTDLLDVPEADASLLFRWSNAIIGDDDLDYQESPEFRKRCLDEIDAYARRLLAERKGGRGNDFVTLVANAEVDGREMDFETYFENFAAFLIAGNETTRHSLSTAVLALTLFPAEKARLISNPSLVPGAVKEIVRWASPLMHVRRTVMKDTEIHGTKIRKGDKVVVWYNSANRDESIWPDASEFRIGRYADRTTAPHLAFGHNPHHCLGWRFAELQVRAVLDEVLRRLPDLHATGEVRRLRSNIVSGIKEMHVAFTPEKRAGPGRATSRQASAAAGPANVGK
jgi:linalool 8-monooxygenase